MTNTVYYIISAVLVLGVLLGISMMSKVKSANRGNTLSAICTLIAIVVVMYNCEILTAWQAWLGLAIGALVGIVGAVKVKMIEMPQAVALLNGFGGLASALVAILTIEQTSKAFELYVGAIALVVGFVTFTGSVVAAGKLHKLLPQKPVVWKGHSFISALVIVAMVAAIVVCPECIWLISLLSAFFGVVFAIRVGGADMPITISLLNSLSGVAGGIAGIAVGDVLLVAIGGVVGASGLLLTQIMCRAMNRSLLSILLGAKSKKPVAVQEKVAQESANEKIVKDEKASVGDILTNAKKVMIVPGYGMALAQAQSIVKTLADKLEALGVEVKYAIHPVAGRMPGHMNVLLCEVDVPYDKLYEMDAINDEFSQCDAAIIIGANDVVNPAANTAEGTPIYGMPVLNASDAKHVIVCNFDDKPGYAGVPNPLYEAPNTIMMLGDAKEIVAALTAAIGNSDAEVEAPAAKEEGASVGDILTNAKKVMIVPGYGMALAQAQSIVKTLADKLEALGVEVKYAIHPVAGRMPGHMNVLLCEVDVPYDKLYEMDAINDEFSQCDAAIIIGANDVVNPAANTAEGTPIYGMPVLSASDAKHVIVCNFDDKPGYAGVPNPLYDAPNTIMMLGDAKETVAKLISSF
ncbi:MAG: NAD(P)(+) transhydrogenase (Re/Si-specific) subunit beta [Clostridia bacterium]|nr:NAD(P)(+) transhydrogenase (Re/Si-specific) subunit beta [Clostridia bacterium]